MPDFNLRQLEVFVTVAELGSFTKASQALFLSQSTVSSHIQFLERSLGITLFARDVKKKITLTEAGQAIYPHAKGILERCRFLTEAVVSNQEQQELLIAASTVPSQCILPELMAAFLTNHASCRYHLQKCDSAQTHQLLMQRQAQIGFVGAILNQAEFDYYPLVQDKIVMLTANNDHFRSLQDQHALGYDLLAEPMVAREQGSGTMAQFQAYLTQLEMDIRSLRIVAQIDQPEAVLNAVESGLGVTVYSELAVKDRLQAGKLLAFELNSDSFYRKLYLVTMRYATFTPLEQAFIDFTKDRYK